MTGVTGDFEGLENFNLEDLHELRHEEKEEVKKQIEAIYIEATSLEKKARELACDTNSKQYILRHAQTLTEKANEMKEKICLASGKSFQTPDELQIAIKQSIASNEEQTLIVERLKRNCSSHGLEYRGQTPGNGNCFFEAITCQLDRIGADVIGPEQLRTNVVNYISTHPSFEGSQGVVLLENFVEDNFPDYCDRMLQNGEYADHVVVIGMSRMLQRDIVIVTSAPSTNNEDSVLWVTGCDGFSGNPILLGHIFENHYQSLQPKGDSGKLDHHTNDKHATNDDNLFIPVDVCNEELSNYNMTHDVEDMPFVEFVRSTFIKKRKNGTDCIVRRLRFCLTFNRNEVDNEDVITKHLMDITITGNFIHRKANKTTLQYRCERCNKPRGKKTGPLNTRANNCQAYVSFQFLTHLSKKAVIIRQQLKHNGHSLQIKEEKHQSRPDHSLLLYIDALLDQGKKPMEILCKAWKWARDQGHFDVHDRRYYLTPVDIKNICQRYKMDKRIHQNDAVAVHELCTQILKEEIIFYQELKEGVQPLVIIYQNEAQRKRMVKLAENVVFLDATYKGLTAYGYSFYALVARDEQQGRGTPLSYCISSDDTGEVVKIFLRSLKTTAENHGFDFRPRSFMVDRDTKEISAINEVFPNSSVLLCWFHVLQAVYRFLNKKESGVSGPMHAHTRKKVIDYIRTMKICTKKEDFSQKVKMLQEKMPSKQIADYLLDNWCTDKWGCRWANYGRHFFHEDQDTNNLVERFFLGMKYHFLGGYANSRVEDLLLLLHGNVTMFYDYLDELAKIGRLKNMGGQRGDKSKLTAENMLKAGLDQTVQWTSSTECTVPSQTAFGTIYNVDIVNEVCNCPAATTRGMCKHVHLAELIASKRNIDLTVERRSEAMDVFNAEQYFYDRDNNQVEVLSRLGNVSVVNLTSFKCTCFANSHGKHCICVMVAKLVVPSPDIESTSIDETKQQLIEDKETTDQAIKRKIEEINLYVNNKNFQTIDVKKKKAICQALTTALHICKTTNFSKTTRKRKQQPLFPSRKSKSPKTDHDYSVSRKCVLKKRGRKVNDDGSFKSTHRKKGSIRKPFQ